MDFNKQYEEIVQKHNAEQELTFEEKKLFAECVIQKGQPFVRDSYAKNWQEYVLCYMQKCDESIDALCFALNVMEELAKAGEHGQPAIEDAESLFKSQIEQKYGKRSDTAYTQDPVMEDGKRDYTDYDKQLSTNLKRGYVETMTAFTVVLFTQYGSYMHFEDSTINDFAMEIRLQLENESERSI